MDFGLILPSYRAGASVAAIDAAAELAAQAGWTEVFTTDHVLVEDSARSQDYFEIFDPLVTLAHVAARQPSLRVGVSVVVVPMRNAVLLAKELATLDVLSGGRLICGVGMGWNRAEFGYVGAAERFAHRGSYVEEAIALWRHLWGGGTGPFEGRFHQFGEVRFGPLPVQGANVPIWMGGRDERALLRAGLLADAYHATSSSPAQLAVRTPVVRAAAADAGRPEPLLSVRVRVRFGPHEAPFYQLAGTPEQMIGELHAFAEVGVGHFAVDFAETDVARLRDAFGRFDAEVCSAVR